MEYVYLVAELTGLPDRPRVEALHGCYDNPEDAKKLKNKINKALLKKISISDADIIKMPINEHIYKERL